MDWMDSEMVLSEDSAAEAGPWTTYSSQRGPFFAMAALSMQIVAIIKGSQVGFTKGITGFVGYEASARNRSTLVYNPTADDSDEFSTTHFMAMVKAVAAVRAHLMVREIDASHRNNTMMRKVFRRATVWLRGAQRSTSFQRYTADTVICEDFDRMPQVVMGHGGVEAGTVDRLAWNRTRASKKGRKMILNTSPEVRGLSNIERVMEDIPDIFRRELPCPQCGGYNPLAFGYDVDSRPEPDTPLARPEYGIVFDWDPAATNDEIAETVRFRCKHCSTEDWYFEDLDACDLRGRWVSENLIQCDKTGKWYERIEDECGEEAFPVRGAYVYPAMLSRTEGWQNIALDYLNARDAMVEGNSRPMKVFVTETLARIYDPPQILTAESEDMIARLEDYGAEVPDWVHRLIMGVDKQARYFAFEILGEGLRKETASIDIGNIAGMTMDRSDASWLALTAQAERMYYKADGTALPIDIVMIDEGFDDANVNDWCSEVPMVRIPCKGVGSFGHEMVRRRSERPSTRYGTWPHNIGVHQASDRVFQLLAIQKPEGWQPGQPVPGLCHFPKILGKYYQEAVDPETGEVIIKSEFFKQLLAQIKVRGVRNKQTVDVYIKPEGARDEWHDARKLCVAGMQMLEMSGNALVELPVRAPRVSEVENVPRASAPKSPLTGVI